MPRFDQSFTGLCEQNLQDTLQLKQRYLDGKPKRVPKSKDKKQQDSVQSSVHVQQKFLKRPAPSSNDDLETSNLGTGAGPSSNNSDNYGEPPVKLQCTTTQQHSNSTHQNNGDGLTKFSVEIVQQLEFTTSAANSQPQQISTNVTVKAHHTNTSVKSDISSPKSSNPSTPASTNTPNNNNNSGSNINNNNANGSGNNNNNSGTKSGTVLDVSTLVECVKQEPDNDFADLDQCALALEKDAAANGGTFGGFSDLIGDDTNDEIMSSAALKDLISDITTNYSDYPDIMKEFDFEDKPAAPAPPQNDKIDDKLSMDNKSFMSTNYFDKRATTGASGGNAFGNLDFPKSELSPAAQTLKQMAEQHQNKHQIGMAFKPEPIPGRNAPSVPFHQDFPPFQNNFNPGMFKNQQESLIKQEIMYNDFDMKRKANAQSMYPPKGGQFSPYGGSPNPHGSPAGYLQGVRPPPPPNQGNGGPGTPGNAYRGGTPPRPPSGPPGGGGGGGSGGGNAGNAGAGTAGGNNGSTLHINQAQQLNINQQSHGHNIQVSAGQHIHLSGDIKGNVSIATQQGMFFNQNTGPQSNNGPSNNPAASSAPPNPNTSNTNNNNSNNVPGGGGSGGMDHHPPPSAAAAANSLNTANNNNSNSNNQMPSLSGMMGNARMNVQQQQQMAEQQKFMHQQQMIRAQQMHQQNHNMVRPPPPDYKTGAAGIMQQQQQQQPRYGPPVRRMAPQQQIPPSGPMIRGNMTQYMMQQQQHMSISRGMYPPRQQVPGPMGGNNMMALGGPMSGGMAMNNVPATGNNSNNMNIINGPIDMPQNPNSNQAEWRHLIMQQQQQQQTNFTQIRSNFQQQQNFNNTNNNNMNSMMNNAANLQHQQQQQQMRNLMANNNPNSGQMMMPSQNSNAMTAAQMNMIHMQQQQTIMHQQQQQQHQNNQMAMTTIHMQQSQHVTSMQQHGNASASQQAQNQQQSAQQHHQQQTSNQQQPSNAPTHNNNALNNFNPHSEFNFEFLDNLQADSNAFTDQELLNSFDSDFNF